LDIHSEEGSLNSLVRSLLVVVALVALLAACGSAVIVSQLRSTPSNSNIAQEFVVEDGDTLPLVSERLQRAKLIKQAILFRTLARFQPPKYPIQAGTYYFSPNMPMRQILEALHTPRGEVVAKEIKGVRVPEGARLEEIAAAVSERMDFDPEEFLQVARNGDYFKTLTDKNDEPKYPVLKDLPEGASLEGYLFPDTYNFFETDTITDTIEKLVARFEEQFGVATANQTIQNRSVHEIVTMASIVQRESGSTEGMKMVASVFWNRINPDKEFAGGRLDADPTVQYIVGNEENWWPNINNTMTLEDIQNLQSPYNTRVNAGLPPGPISAPSLAALTAAAEPADTNFFFFVAKCNEPGHNFAETPEEFAQFEQELLECDVEETPTEEQ
jgi:UPF0755 protein